MSKIVITGGASGIGYALSEELWDQGHYVSILDKSKPTQVFGQYYEVNLKETISIQTAADDIGPVDIVVNCAGVNYINWIEDTPEEEWDNVMDTNAKALFLTTQSFLPTLLDRKGTILNIVSNASHMPMTNSIAYNASKGAAHIMTLQMARELGPKGITVFGVSPNRVGGTKMSEYIDNRVCGLRGWTEEYAREYQIKALPAGEETSPTVLAEFLGFILSTKERHKYMAGTIIPYGK